MKITKNKLLSLLAVAGLSLVGGASASAWGPERTLFTWENPASYPVFNSITNNPTIGDERDFVRIGEYNKGGTTSLVNEVKIVPGKQYMVEIFYHNNASSTYNDKAHDYAGIAQGTRLSTSFPSSIKAGEKASVYGKIFAKNSNPAAVWDEAYMTTSSSQVFLSFVEGSARIYNDWQLNHSVLPTAMFTETGMLLGLNELNGLIPGCEEYQGRVVYIIEAKEVDGKIEKAVSKDGKNFKQNTELKAGEEATFKLTIKNTGGFKLTNVVIKDTLPAGMSLVPGSVELWANSSTTKEKISDAIVSTGINLGNIGTGNTVYITYRAKASADFKCKGANLVNSVNMSYGSEKNIGGSKNASSKITVLKENCEEEKKKPGFEMDKKISLDNSKWQDNISAKPGDTAHFRITFKNVGEIAEKNVMMQDVMNKDAGLEYVPGTLKITRMSGNSDSITSAIAEIPSSDDFFNGGIMIGEVAPGETITATYDVKFVAGKFECGTTTLYNNASVSGKIGDNDDITIVNDSVEIKIVRDDEECDTPKEDCTNHPEAPECNFPETGPVEVVMAAIIILGIGGGGFYFYRTKKSLKNIESAAQGKKE